MCWCVLYVFFGGKEKERVREYEQGRRVKVDIMRRLRNGEFLQQ